MGDLGGIKTRLEGLVESGPGNLHKLRSDSLGKTAFAGPLYGVKDP